MDKKKVRENANEEHPRVGVDGLDAAPGIGHEEGNLLEIAFLKEDIAELKRTQGLKHLLEVGKDPIGEFLRDDITGEKQQLRARLAEAQSELVQLQSELVVLKRNVWSYDQGNEQWDRCFGCDVIELNNDHTQCDYGCLRYWCPDCWSSIRGTLPMLVPRQMLLGPYTGNMCVSCAKTWAEESVDSISDEDNHLADEDNHLADDDNHSSGDEDLAEVASGTAPEIVILYTDANGLAHSAFSSSSEADTDTDDDNRMTGDVSSMLAGGEAFWLRYESATKIQALARGYNARSAFEPQSNTEDDNSTDAESLNLSYDESPDGMLSWKFTTAN